MAGMPWVKIYTDILDEPKLAELEDSQKWRFVQLILVAAECDAEGALVTGDSPMSHKQLAWRLRCDAQILKIDIDKMLEIGLLEEDDDILVVAKFSERQGPTQAEKRKQWRERQKRRRERAKKKKAVTGESRVTHDGVTVKEEEEELKTDSSADADAPKSKKKTEFQKNMEHLEEVFAEARGTDPPDWNGDAKAANKRWRTPLGQILSKCDKDLSKAEVVVRNVTAKMKQEGLTFDAPDQILKTASSYIIDLKENKVNASVEW